MANDNEKNVFTSTKVEDNEVIKAIDIQYGFDSQIDNVSKALMMILESKKDFVVGGKLKPYSGKLSVIAEPLYGVCISNGKCFGNTATSNAIVFETPSAKKRIDIVEVRGIEETFATEQRAFNDLETDIKAYREVDTKKKLSCEFVVKKGVPGSVTAPKADTGFVKLAEVVIDTNTVNITADNIKNITADIPELDNTSWTNEKDRTYNIGYISDVNKRFRKDHNQDGTHKSNIIGKAQLKSDVNGTSLQIGKDVTVNNTVTIGSSSAITTAIDTLAQKITSLFTDYQKNGIYNFKGEVSISNKIGDGGTYLTNALKLWCDGNGTAKLKLNGKEIFTITQDGKIRTTTAYNATDSKDLITKSVTDAIDLEIEKIKQKIKEIDTQLNYQTYTNNVLSRYTTIDSSIEVATTQNITLNGSQNIDGEAVVDGTKVLVKNQNNKVENGIYRASGTNWVRYTGYTTAESLKYKYFKIGKGKVNKDKLFYVPDEKFEIGTEEGKNDINFSEYVKIKTDQLNDKVVTTEKINDGSVTTAKFASTAKSPFSGTADLALQVKDDVENVSGEKLITDYTINFFNGTKVDPNEDIDFNASKYGVAGRWWGDNIKGKITNAPDYIVKQKSFSLVNIKFPYASSNYLVMQFMTTRARTNIYVRAYNPDSGHYYGWKELATTDGRVASVGNDNNYIIPSEGNEINFAGFSDSDTIFFGFTPKGNRPIPTKYVFGNNIYGSAEVLAKSFIQNGYEVNSQNKIGYRFEFGILKLNTWYTCLKVKSSKSYILIITKNGSNVSHEQIYLITNTYNSVTSIFQLDKKGYNAQAELKISTSPIGTDSYISYKNKFISDAKIAMRVIPISSYMSNVTIENVLAEGNPPEGFSDTIADEKALPSLNSNEIATTDSAKTIAQDEIKASIGDQVTFQYIQETKTLNIIPKK